MGQALPVPDTQASLPVRLSLEMPVQVNPRNTFFLELGVISGQRISGVITLHSGK